jgi:hypothetical protein
MTFWVYRRLETDVFNYGRDFLGDVDTGLQSVTYLQSANLLLMAL